MVAIKPQSINKLQDLLPGEMFLIKVEDSQAYGGPEEGGWWYNMAIPQWKYGIPLPLPRKLRYMICRYLNRRMRRLHNDQQEYGYTSVLSYRSTFYSFDLMDGIKPQNPERPHYG